MTESPLSAGDHDLRASRNGRCPSAERAMCSLRSPPSVSVDLPDSARRESRPTPRPIWPTRPVMLHLARRLLRIQHLGELVDERRPARRPQTTPTPDAAGCGQVVVARDDAADAERRQKRRHDARAEDARTAAVIDVRVPGRSSWAPTSWSPPKTLRRTA